MPPTYLSNKSFILEEKKINFYVVSRFECSKKILFFTLWINYNRNISVTLKQTPTHEAK